MCAKLRASTALQRDLSLEIQTDQVQYRWEGVTAQRRKGAGGWLARQQLSRLVEGSWADNASTSQQCVLMAKAANYLLDKWSKCLGGRWKEVLTPSYSYPWDRTCSSMFSLGLPSTRQTLSYRNENSVAPPRWLKGWGTWRTQKERSLFSFKKRRLLAAYSFRGDSVENTEAGSSWRHMVTGQGVTDMSYNMRNSN